MEDNLRYLADLYGIELSYTDSLGNKHDASEQTVRKILASMGAKTESWQDTEDRIKELLLKRANRAIAPTLTYTEGENPLFTLLTVSARDPWQSISWTIIEEDGVTEHSGTFERYALNLKESNNFWDETWETYEIAFPVKLPLGYHKLILKGLTCTENALVKSCIIIGPKESYLPKELSAGWKYWGIQSELFRLRSDNDWGIGDFTSLIKLCDIAKELGAKLLTIAPLHALDVRDQRGQNPFYPTDRMALNILFIDITSIPEVINSPELQAYINTNTLQKKIKKLQEQSKIDYRSVFNLKISVLEHIYEHFCREHLSKQTDRAKEFETYKKLHPAIEKYSIFQALKEYFEQLQFVGNGWRYWETRFQDPSSPAVSEFKEKNIKRICFYQFLQWLADEQLAKASQYAKSQQIDIFHSIATNPRASSSESWNNQDVFANNVFLGLPPAPQNPQGLNTRTCCWNPHKLQETHFKAFIEILRNSMQYATGLRLGQFALAEKLFWIPDKESPNNGVYVRYPIKDIMTIINLESTRNKCLIASDLPANKNNEFLNNSNIIQRKFYLRSVAKHDYHQSWDYAQRMAVAIADHDTPSIKDFWLGADILEDSSLLNALELQEELAVRAQERELVVKALSKEGAVHWQERRQLNASDIILGLYRLLARSPALILIVNLQDLITDSGMPYLDESFDGNPKWVNRIAINLEALQGDFTLKSIVSAIKSEGRS